MCHLPCRSALPVVRPMTVKLWQPAPPHCLGRVRVEVGVAAAVKVAAVGVAAVVEVAGVAVEVASVVVVTTATRWLLTSKNKAQNIKVPVTFDGFYGNLQRSPQRFICLPLPLAHSGRGPPGNQATLTA